MKAALSTIFYLSDWQKFRSLTMVCVVRLGGNRHIARGATPGERNLHATFLVRRKGKQTHTHIYLHAYFCAKKYRKDKLECNENCECFPKSCKIKYKKEGRPQCTKCSLFAEPSAGDCLPENPSHWSLPQSTHFHGPSAGRRQFLPVQGPLPIQWRNPSPRS